MQKVWGHDGCGAYWRLKLTSCPRHPGETLKETEMPKNTLYGGHSIAGITDTATGQTEHGAGLVEDTEATRLKAAARASDDPTGDGYTDQGDAVGAGLLAGGDDTKDEDGEKVAAPFDPSGLNVADVVELLADCSPAEKEAVQDAERNGKARAGILNA